MRILKRLNQSGDTIIEVLICMAIVSFSLGISYGIARRSLSQVRVAQERTEALKIAEQQIERIKQYIQLHPAGSPNDAFGPNGFNKDPAKGQCILNVGGTTLTIKGGISDPKGPDCAVDSSGSFDLDDGAYTAPTAVDNIYPYRAGFVYDNILDPLGVKQFYVFAGRFTATGGGGANTRGFDVVTLQYRAHP